jgi:hypothetical protein
MPWGRRPPGHVLPTSMPTGPRAARCGRYALGVICAGELRPGLAWLRAGMLISAG